MDIKEFYKSHQQNSQYSSNQNFDTNTSKNSKNFAEYESIIDKYKDLPQSELMSELINQASSLKQQGKLNDTTLTQIASTLGPMLNNEQKQLLNNIIERLK